MGGITLESKILTPKELMKQYGYHKEEIKYAINHKEMPYCEPTRGKIFFNRREIDNWIMSHKKVKKQGNDNE